MRQPVRLDSLWLRKASVSVQVLKGAAAAGFTPRTPLARRFLLVPCPPVDAGAPLSNLTGGLNSAHEPSAGLRPFRLARPPRPARGRPPGPRPPRPPPAV